MTQEKPREFWITEAQRKMYAFNDSESAEQCAKRSDALYNSTGSHVIHVIEHSAYAALEQKVKELESANTVLSTKFLWLVRHAFDSFAITKARAAELLGVPLIDVDRYLEDEQSDGR